MNGKIILGLMLLVALTQATGRRTLDHYGGDYDYDYGNDYDYDYGYDYEYEYDYDFDAYSGSCLDNCGNSDNGCFCDSGCLGYNDCCHDHTDYCCGSDEGKCSNDVDETFTISFVSTITVGDNDSVTEVPDIARRGAAKALGVSEEDVSVVIYTGDGRRRRQLGTDVTLEFTVTTTNGATAADAGKTATSPTFSSDLETGMQEAAEETGSSITVEGVTVDEVNTDFFIDTCDDGTYYDSITDDCANNQCTATMNCGAGATGVDCPENSGAFCAANGCAQGYFFDDGICPLNVCIAPANCDTAAEGDLCPTNSDTFCDEAGCGYGYYFDGGLCPMNVCVAPASCNIPAEGTLCPENNMDACDPEGCAVGSYFENLLCLENQCIAPNNCATAATGVDCATNGDVYCAIDGCAAGYSNEMGQCYPDCPTLEKKDCKDEPNDCVWEWRYSEKHCRSMTECDSIIEKNDCKNYESADDSDLTCYWNKNIDGDDTTEDIPFCMPWPASCDYWSDKASCKGDVCLWNSKLSTKCIPVDTPCATFTKKNSCNQMDACGWNKKEEDIRCFDASLECSVWTEKKTCKAWTSPDGKCKFKNDVCKLK